MLNTGTNIDDYTNTSTICTCQEQLQAFDSSPFTYHQLLPEYHYPVENGWNQYLEFRLPSLFLCI